ncbi:spermidine/putrescine ABC transporter ATP-binding protein [Clostridium zeae]|uniref:Spermidine/putrescine ABC transporter ATP-binding protein n=1 Tax=Clostridium zeae TaxID=2759022 RepID=A0ABQ1EA54_9CLOT|nr:ABC transporter ATP-binding protein [Clostridium zeae]GFZ31660.1 spermidine/putrescine ABC transporter ATP-binding protein [Clostridium zeae]
MALLEIKDIYMNFHTPESVIEALNNINITIEKGDFVSVIGPSGCGKSTLLNIISGLLKPSSGEILFNGTNSRSNQDIVGYMFQKDNLFEWLTLWDNVTLGLKIKKLINKENIEKVDLLLSQYGLSKFKKSYPSQLSGGMRQRAALIRTLALEPEILLLDEPFSALDYQTRLKVCDEIFQIIKKENKTAIMVTHDISEAISTSSKIVVLSKRPSVVKRELFLDFNENLTPLQRRDEKQFREYFNITWKELDLNDE